MTEQSSPDPISSCLLTRRRMLVAGGACVVGIGLATQMGLAAMDGDGDAEVFGTLKALARNCGIRFGTAVSPQTLADEQARALILRECDVVTPENQFKWRFFEPAQGKFDFSPAREVVAFARSNRLELRGHCFVWDDDRSLPQWLLDAEDEFAHANGRALLKRMDHYAHQLHRRAPQVASWDVVNEAIEPESGVMRSTLFQRVLGSGHIDAAFEMMRDRNPRSQLVYNDSMTWGRQAKHRDGVLRLLERSLSRGVPIQALGIQSHLGKTLGKPVFEREWYDFLREVNDMGLRVLITELDCSDQVLTELDPARRDVEVAEFVRRYLDITLAFANVDRLVVWSMSDATGYMNRPSYPDNRRRADGLPLRGYVYDADFQPKPMRTAIAEALRAAPERKA